MLRFEAYPDEDEFYGEEVAPLARRWRAEWVALRVYRLRPRYGYQHRLQLRVLELELRLMEEYGLTLPPDEVEITGVQREDAIRWRRQRLVELGSMVADEEREGRTPAYVAPYPTRRAAGGWLAKLGLGRREVDEPERGDREMEAGGVRSFAGRGRWQPLPWPELRAEEVESRVARVNIRVRDTERLAAVEGAQRGPRNVGWTAEEMSGPTSEPPAPPPRRGMLGRLKR